MGKLSMPVVLLQTGIQRLEIPVYFASGMLAAMLAGRAVSVND